MDEETKKRFDTLEKKIDTIGKILSGGLKVRLQVPGPQIVPGAQSKIILPTLTRVKPGEKDGSPRRVQK